MLGVLEKVSVVLLRRKRSPQLRLYTVMAEPWKRSGLVRGIGIPAPSGQHPVGCVDLMHQARNSLSICSDGSDREFWGDLLSLLFLFSLTASVRGR